MNVVSIELAALWLHPWRRRRVQIGVSFFFFQAEDGIRDGRVMEFRRVLFRAVDVGLRRGVDDDVPRPERGPHRLRIADVERRAVEIDRAGQVRAQRAADLPARAGYENAGIRSHWRRGFLVSRSLTTGGPSSCQSMARVGSSQATPFSSSGSYSRVTQ